MQERSRERSQECKVFLTFHGTTKFTFRNDRKNVHEQQQNVLAMFFRCGFFSSMHLILMCLMHSNFALLQKAKDGFHCKLKLIRIKLISDDVAA